MMILYTSWFILKVISTVAFSLKKRAIRGTRVITTVAEKRSISVLSVPLKRVKGRKSPTPYSLSVSHQILRENLK